MTFANYGRISQALRGLLPPNPPPTIAQRTGNLYEVLSRATGGGVGKHVYQTRWRSKAISNCYWEITRARFKCEGKHGKAWGKMYWKGKLVSEREERVRGALKYDWQEGIS